MSRLLPGTHKVFQVSGMSRSSDASKTLGEPDDRHGATQVQWHLGAW